MRVYTDKGVGREWPVTLTTDDADVVVVKINKTTLRLLIFLFCLKQLYQWRDMMMKGRIPQITQ